RDLFRPEYVNVFGVPLSIYEGGGGETPPRRNRAPRLNLCPSAIAWNCAGRMTGQRKFILPSLPPLNKPVSENTFNLVLRRTGFGADETTSDFAPPLPRCSTNPGSGQRMQSSANLPTTARSRLLHGLLSE